MRPLPTRVDLELGFSIVHIVRFPSLWRYRNAFTANHDFPFPVIPCLLRSFFSGADGRGVCIWFLVVLHYFMTLLFPAALALEGV